jgi:UDP-2,3-diacylglucosamine pyrophosphatase LpxH
MVGLEEQEKSVIVVADTHFGLCNANQGCDPIAFADFLRWVKNLENGGKESLKLGYWDSTVSADATVDFHAPEKMIFLGDILELWDSPNETIISSTVGLFSTLSELECEKIYVLGNHDNDLAYLANNYPLGNSILRMYPEDYMLRKGDDVYYFLHGHQFDKNFSTSSWRVIPSIRKAALAFGDYSLLFLILFIADLALMPFGFGGVESILSAFLLGFMSIPYLFIKLARGAWNNFRSTKYNPDYAVNHALLWKKFPESGSVGSPALNIVYGHTHAIDRYDFEDLDTGEVEFSLFNLPSWVTDFSVNVGTPLEEESIEREISNVFLYITENFRGFVGWDRQEKKTFFIPPDIVSEKRSRGNIAEYKLEVNNKLLIDRSNLEQELERIGWPRDLIKKWVTGFTTGHL